MNDKYQILRADQASASRARFCAWADLKEAESRLKQKQRAFDKADARLQLLDELVSKAETKI